MKANKQKKSVERRKKRQHKAIVLQNAIPSAQTIVCARNMTLQSFLTVSRPPSAPLGFVVFRQKTRKRPPRV